MVEGDSGRLWGQMFWVQIPDLSLDEQSAQIRAVHILGA